MGKVPRVPFEEIEIFTFSVQTEMRVNRSQAAEILYRCFIKDPEQWGEAHFFKEISRLEADNEKWRKEAKDSWAYIKELQKEIKGGK